MHCKLFLARQQRCWTATCINPQHGLCSSVQEAHKWASIAPCHVGGADDGCLQTLLHEPEANQHMAGQSDSSKVAQADAAAAISSAFHNARRRQAAAGSHTQAPGDVARATRCVVASIKLAPSRALPSLLAATHTKGGSNNRCICRCKQTRYACDGGHIMLGARFRDAAHLSVFLCTILQWCNRLCVRHALRPQQASCCFFRTLALF